MFVERVGSLWLFAIFLWVLSLPHIHSFFLSFFNSFFPSFFLWFFLSLFIFFLSAELSLLCSAFHHHPHLLCLSDQAHLLSISSSPDIVNQPHSELQCLPALLSLYTCWPTEICLCALTVQPDWTVSRAVSFFPYHLILIDPFQGPTGVVSHVNILTHEFLFQTQRLILHLSTNSDDGVQSSNSQRSSCQGYCRYVAAQ